MMPLPFIDIELSDVTQVGVSVDSFFLPITEHYESEGLAIMVRGRCYAFDYTDLYDNAIQSGKAWHMMLLETFWPHYGTKKPPSRSWLATCPEISCSCLF